jgi:hypothetical protein
VNALFASAFNFAASNFFSSVIEVSFKLKVLIWGEGRDDGGEDAGVVSGDVEVSLIVF